MQCQMQLRLRQDKTKTRQRRSRCGVYMGHEAIDLSTQEKKLAHNYIQLSHQIVGILTKIRIVISQLYESLWSLYAQSWSGCRCYMMDKPWRPVWVQHLYGRSCSDSVKKPFNKHRSFISILLGFIVYCNNNWIYSIYVIITYIAYPSFEAGLDSFIYFYFSSETETWKLFHFDNMEIKVFLSRKLLK